MTLDPRDTGTLKQIMRDPWLDMSQKEEFRHDNEPPSDDMETWVTEETMNLGLERCNPGLNINRQNTL